MISGSDEAALAAQQGNPAQVEHGENVGVGELVLEAEADDVELAEGSERLERDERLAVLAQQRFEVDPGGVGALRVDVGAPIEQIVEDLQPGMGLGDLVDLRKGKGEAQGDVARVLADRATLVAEVAARLFDPRKEGLEHGSREFHHTCATGPPPKAR